MTIVFLKSKQAKTRVDLKRKRVGLENGIVSLEPSKLGLYFNVYLVSKIIKVHDFVPYPKVGQFMCVVIDNMIQLFCLIDNNKIPCLNRS